MYHDILVQVMNACNVRTAFNKRVDALLCNYIECSPVNDPGHIHVRSSTDNVLLAQPLTAVQLKIKKCFVIH